MASVLNSKNINILFVSIGATGKTSIISCLTNGIYHFITSRGGTLKPTCYQEFKYIYDEKGDAVAADGSPNISSIETTNVYNIDIKIKDYKVNLIDTEGYRLTADGVIQNKYTPTEHIDLIIYVLDANLPLRPELFAAHADITNSLVIINKANDCDDIHMIENIKNIKRELEAKTSFVITADNILTCKSIINGFTEKIPKIKLEFFKFLFDGKSNAETLEILNYNELLKCIHDKLSIQNIKTTRIMKHLDTINNIRELMDMCEELPIEEFNKYLILLLNKKNGSPGLLYNLTDESAIVKINQNITLQHCMTRLITFDYIMSTPESIKFCFAFDILAKRILTVLINAEITNDNIEKICKYINRNWCGEIYKITKLINNHIFTGLYGNISVSCNINVILLKYANYIDELLFKICKHIYTNGTMHDTYILYKAVNDLFSDVKIYNEQISKRYPLFAKLKLITIDFNNYLLANNNLIDDQEHYLFTFINNIFESPKNTLAIQKKKYIDNYLNANIVLFPCIDKQPFIKAWNYIDIHRSRTLIDQLKSKNIGMVCGALSDIFVLDVDAKDEGLTFFKGFLDKYNGGAEIDTLTVNTANGGKHYYFALDDKTKLIPTRNKVFSTETKKIGIDTRNNNGYVIAPGSILEGEKQYLFANYDNTQPLRSQIKPMPQWLFFELNEWFKMNNCGYEFIANVDAIEDTPIQMSFKSVNEYEEDGSKKKLYNNQYYVSGVSGSNDLGTIGIYGINPKNAAKRAMRNFNKHFGCTTATITVMMMVKMKQYTWKYNATYIKYSKPYEITNKFLGKKYVIDHTIKIS